MSNIIDQWNSTRKEFQEGTAITNWQNQTVRIFYNRTFKLDIFKEIGCLFEMSVKENETVAQNSSLTVF